MSSSESGELFARRLRQIRLQRQLEQSELASLCGIPATSISHFEAGRRKPNLVNLRNLADALKVSVDYLLGRTTNPEAHIEAAAYRHKKLQSERDRKLLKEIEELLAKT